MSSERQKDLIEFMFNYVEHPAMKAYFDAKEHEAYYRSLDTNQRRDFHERLIPVLTNFIAEASSLEAQSILDNTIFKAASSSVLVGASLDVIKAAERENSRGFSMLKIAPPLTFDTLKQYYREAAKRYHPDVGGTTEEMQIINAAYQQFHDLLCMTHKGVSGEGDQDSPFESISIQSTLDYLYVIGKLLVYVYFDEWAVDHAYYWLNMLDKHGWANSDCALNWQQRQYFIDLCSKLAMRLHVVGMAHEANFAVQLAKRCQQPAAHSDREISVGRFLFAEVQAVFSRKKKLRIILNHRRQAENALRLKLIDEKRYAKVLNRLEQQHQTESEQERLLREAVADRLFMQNLPADRELQGLTTQATLIPEPRASLWTNQKVLDALSDEQKAEYLTAFSSDTTLNLVQKYCRVRLESLLRSVIYGYDEIEMEDVLRECHVLEKAGRPKGSDRDTCKAVIQLCEFIRGLNQNEREGRLKLLQTLDKKSHSPGNTPSAESDGYRPRFSIQSFADYCRIAQLPVERLELALKTGQIKTEEEEQQEREAFYFTLRLLGSQEGRRAKKALESFAHQHGQRQRLDPTLDLTHVALEVVEAVPPFYSKLIEATKISPRPDMLRIGVTAHAIVRALVELARWREAKEWTSHYFSLPMEYQDGKQREMKTLSDRCERMIKKIE